jgi:hypothetical protein
MPVPAPFDRARGVSNNTVKEALVQKIELLYKIQPECLFALLFEVY